MLHLGLGNFFRAHQAWYTAAAGGAWDITAFTGRSAGLADALNAQGCRYTLVVRGPEKDEPTVIETVRAAFAGTDRAAWLREWSRPELAVVTLTVTEAAYRGDVPLRLAAGLAARRAAGGGPLAVVSCDNLPSNGAVTARAVLAAADAGDQAGLRGWIEENVSFVTTMVDRITPATTGADVREVAELTGWADAAPVITEPFSEWVLSGDFPAGRPAWENGGARFVDDAEPYERRKLWLLNGGHTLLAYVGSLRGHETVAAALADPFVRELLEEWWEEASPGLPDPGPYRESLIERWSNRRIEHRLAQIAADGSTKIPIRLLPALERARSEGRLSRPVVQVLAAWVRHVRGESVPVRDAGVTPGARSVPDVLGLLDPRLAADQDLIAAVNDLL